MKKRKVKKTRVVLLVFILLLLVGIGCGAAYLIHEYKENQKVETLYLAGDHPTVNVFDENMEEVSFYRGSELTVKLRPATVEEEEYRLFIIDDKKYYVKDDVLVADRNDCVRETSLYTLRNTVVTSDVDSFLISGYLNKNTEVTITGFDELKADGTIDNYYVNNLGWIPASKLDYTYHYEGLDSSIYSEATYHAGGDPTLIDYYEKEEVKFEDNVMPDIVRALYLNGGAIINAERYIDLANGTDINAFVVDIKDCYVDTQVSYDSPVTAKYAPSSTILNTYDEFKENVKKLKDAGYYVIGRITAFKDDAFAHDNPDESLMWPNGGYYHYGFVDWPSIYSRKMWEYNVALATEAVVEMGFNEIQFDYARSPEDIDDGVLRRNTYDETPSQAITEFLRYATENMHKIGAYISADVFGEISGWTTQSCTAFVSYYGQFWPAISNVVDAISSMPYPDHFSNGAFGIDYPWDQPGSIMYAWAKATWFAQDETYYPAKCRTWIQVQDPAGRDYDKYDIKAQIDGLKNAGVYDGFMTWNAASSYYFYNMCIDVLN